MVKTGISWPGSKPRRWRGVTLLELLVVLVLMSAMLALVPPLFDRGLTTTGLNAVAREIMAAMRYARSSAVSNRQQIAFTVDLKNHLVRVEGKRPVELPETMQLELVTGQSKLRGRGAGSITFYPDGSASGGSLTLEADKRRLRLDVDWLSGRVSLHE